MISHFSNQLISYTFVGICWYNSLIDFTLEAHSEYAWPFKVVFNTDSLQFTNKLQSLLTVLSILIYNFYCAIIFLFLAFFALPFVHSS